MTPALRWTLAAAVEALLVVLMLPYGFLFTFSLPIHQFQVALLAVVGGIGWLAVLRRPSRLPRQVVLAPLPLLAALALSSMTSAYPTLSWLATWQVAAYTGVFWLLAFQASHPAGRRNLLGALGIVLLLVLASYILAVAMAWRTWLELGFSIASLPIRPAYAGGLAQIPTWLADAVVTVSPVLIAALWRRGATGIGVALAAITLAAIAVTGTRSIVLVLAGLGVVLLMIVIVRGRGALTVVAAAVTSTAVAATAAWILLISPRPFDQGRSSAYASAVDQFLEFPVVGGGPGTYGVRRMDDLVDTLGPLAFPDAHNLILTTAAETGLVGLVGLLMTAALLGMAIHRTWSEAPAQRPIIVGALLGVAVLAGHGMIDLIFGLIGIIVMATAAVALAATHERPSAHNDRRGMLDAALVPALAVVVLSTAGLLRTEMTFAALDDADRTLETSPAAALAIARHATERAPDSVPAWWVQMAAADASGDTASAISAARRMIELEGFGQQWMSLAILSSRSGDRATELDAISHARQGPVDPIVELNAVVLLDAIGDARGADAAAIRLLGVQPDIEPVLADGPTALSSRVARIRDDVARGRLSAGSTDTAMLIALSGEDRSLADELVETIAATDTDGANTWETIVNAWFGDPSAMAALEGTSVRSPTLSLLTWSWRVAAHACLPDATERWGNAVRIAGNTLPSTPIQLGVSPDFQAWQLPSRYPSFVWRLTHPNRPYVGGTWTYQSGRPACAQPD